MKKCDVAIIGAGVAGLSLALNILRLDDRLRVVVIEREDVAGGVLNLANTSQSEFEFENSSYKSYEICKILKDKLCEYANFELMLNTSALSVRRRTVMAISHDSGIEEVKAKAVVFCTGAVEKTQGVLNIPGFRPSGIITAGAVQYELYRGSGFEDVKKVVVYGISPSSISAIKSLSALGKEIILVEKRDVDIEENLILSVKEAHSAHKIIDIVGKSRLKSVRIAQCDSVSCSINVREIDCDMLLLGCGYLPFVPLMFDMKIRMNPATKGPWYDKATYSTSKDGIFAAGDALYIHDRAQDIYTQNAEVADRIVKYLGRRNIIFNTLLRSI